MEPSGPARKGTRTSGAHTSHAEIGPFPNLTKNRTHFSVTPAKGRCLAWSGQDRKSFVPWEMRAAMKCDAFRSRLNRRPLRLPENDSEEADDLNYIQFTVSNCSSYQLSASASIQDVACSALSIIEPRSRRTLYKKKNEHLIGDRLRAQPVGIGFCGRQAKRATC